MKNIKGRRRPLPVVEGCKKTNSSMYNFKLVSEVSVEAQLERTGMVKVKTLENFEENVSVVNRVSLLLNFIVNFLI